MPFIKYVLKFFRRIYSDKNPDYEMSRFLSEKKDFKNTPRYLGSINFIDKEQEVVTIAVMQELVPNDGDAWDVFLVEIDCPNYSIYITPIIIRCIKRYNDAFSYVFSCE